MPNADFFPDRPDAQPIIYAYREPNNCQLQGMLKVGYTSRTIEERMHEHYPTLKPGEKPYEVVFVEPAMRSDGTTFMDYPVHDKLDDYGFKRLRDEDGKKTEWHRCTVEHVRAAYLAVRDRTENFELRTRDFMMRPEQDAAVRKTERYFIDIEYDGGTRTPKFLWNAKMRFGKTFAAYELAKRMGFRRVLILTFKPAVLAAWEEDLLTHVDFEGWQFISRPKEPGKPDISKQQLESQNSALNDAIATEKAREVLMADEQSIAAIFERYAHANLDDPQVRDNVLTYFVNKIYVYDDKLLITGDFVDGVGDDRYDREHYWSFCDYETVFASDKVFDLREFNSTICNLCSVRGAFLLSSAGP